MIEMDRASDYTERAHMHEQLAETTSDEPARKMHQAMAAEYRRKAVEASGGITEMAAEPHVDARLMLMESHG